MIVYLTDKKKYNPRLCLFCQKHRGKKEYRDEYDFVFEKLVIPESFEYYIDCGRSECLDKTENTEATLIQISQLTGWRFK